MVHKSVKALNELLQKALSQADWFGTQCNHKNIHDLEKKQDYFQENLVMAMMDCLLPEHLCMISMISKYSFSNRDHYDP